MRNAQCIQAGDDIEGTPSGKLDGFDRGDARQTSDASLEPMVTVSATEEWRIDRAERKQVRVGCDQLQKYAVDVDLLPAPLEQFLQFLTIATEAHSSTAAVYDFNGERQFAERLQGGHRLAIITVRRQAKVFTVLPYPRQRGSTDVATAIYRHALTLDAMA